MEPTADHTGVIVSDLERAVTFYRDGLGMDVVDRFDVEGPGLSTAVGAENVAGSFAILDAGGARLELVEYEPSGADRTGAAVTDTGSFHLGLSVDDVDAAVADLEGREDVTFVSEPQTTGSGTRIVFLRDPDGNLIELLAR